MSRKHLRKSKTGYRAVLNVEAQTHSKEHAYPWWQVLWLTGVDYFSTLAYQPGIALLAAGMLSPIATLLLILVTLCGALPVYMKVAERSFAGQGSIAMLEHMLSGWWSKLSVLILLGFAATDFMITMTLSAADAAQHIVENPALSAVIGDSQIRLTLLLLAMLGIVFLLGFKEAIRVAGMIAIPYIALNLVILGYCLLEIFLHPERLGAWSSNLSLHGDITGILLVCALVFPRLALGLSGFETGVTVMPLVKGDDIATSEQAVLSRIRNTKKLLLTAAFLMSCLLILSSFVTTILIDSADFNEGGRASGRAISFLAHSFLGVEFGTLYDISTVAILWFAGASAMAGLLQIIPRYLPRFGMAPDWVSHTRPLVLLIVGFNFLITFAFNASVEAQAGAYATGVLVLILSASFAVALSLWKEGKNSHGEDRNALLRKSAYFWLVLLVFAYTLLDNIFQRVDGIIVASVFIGLIIASSIISRLLRATELRISDLKFVNDSSENKWEQIVDRKVHLVAIKGNYPHLRKHKENAIRQFYFIEGPLAFLYIDLADDRSEFVADLRAEVTREQGNYLITVKGANSIANTIAFVSETMRPKSIFLSLTRRNLLGQALRFFFWGEGETGILVYRILLKHWDDIGYLGVRPNIFLMSD